MGTDLALLRERDLAEGFDVQLASGDRLAVAEAELSDVVLSGRAFEMLPPNFS
jgi:hypothetical protein